MNNVVLKTKDNINIAINHCDNQKDAVVILCPGWFMTKDSALFLKMTEAFKEMYDVIAMDFRGHGKSGGYYTFMAKEELDLDAVINYAKDKYRKIYLCGFSLGAGLVLLHGAKCNDVAKIVAISAPSDFMKIENHMYSPNAWIPTLFQKFEPKRWLTIRAGFPLLKKDKPIDYVDKIQVPTLFIAGDKDPTVFAWHTKALYDKACCKKEYILFEKARHAEDLYHDYPEKLFNACVNWFDNN